MSRHAHAPSIIHRTTNGNVAWFPCCRAIGTEFGNIALRFSVDEFTAFSVFLDGIALNATEAEERPTDPHERSIAVRLGSSGMALRFSRIEIEEFRDLLSGALRVIKLELPQCWPGYLLN